MKQKKGVYENGLTFLKLRVPSLLTDGEPGYFYSNHNYNKIPCCLKICSITICYTIVTFRIK